MKREFNMAFRNQVFCLVSLALAFVSVAEAEAKIMNLFPRALFEEGIQLSAARMLGGDFTQLNELIFDVRVPVSTEDLQPDPIDIGFGVSAVIALGDGYCENIQVRPEGDIQVHSGLGDSYTEDSTIYERIFLELRALALTFRCFVEMEVSLFLAGGIPLNGNNGGPGTLVFFPAEDGVPPGAFLNTSIDIFSEDFSETFPAFANSTGCNADISKLDYSESTNLGTAILVGDITSIVVGRLEDDPTLVQEPVERKLCGLLENVTDFVGDFLVNNPLTNVTVVETDILGAENALPTPSEDVDLLDWGDNFITNFLFPENGTSDTLDNLLANRSIAEIIGGFLDVDIGEGEGIDSLDLMPLLGPLINEDYDPSLPLLNVSNLLNISSLRIELYVDNLFLSTTKLDIDLSAISFPGKLTISLPTVDLGDLDLLANIRIVVSLDEISLGDIELTGLALDESFQLELDWDSFSIDASIFVPVNLAAFPSLQFGGLTTSTLTCLLSTLYVSPMITALDIGSSQIGLQLNGFQDAIAFLVGDLVNNVFPTLEGAAKIFLDTTVDNAVVNQELLEVPTCPVAEIEDDTIPYDFSRGIFKTVSDFVTEDLVEKAVDLLAGVIADDNSTILTLIDEDSAISFSLSLQGQGIDFGLYHLGIFGLRPPTIREVVLLFADPASVYFPQELVNILKAASEENPIGATIKFTLDFSDAIVANNDISITVSLDTIEAALDIFAKLSKYDVDSITLENIINLDCWMAGLDNPGGVLDLALLLDGLDIDTSCDCELVPLRQIINAIATPKGIAVISDLLNSLLDVLEYVVESPFAPENWDLTITNADRRCNGLEPLPSETKLLNPPVLNLVVPQALGGLLIVAINISLIVSCCFKRKKKGAVIEKSQEESHQSRSTSLFRSPSLPLIVRVGFPVLILSNIMMFIAGDLDTAVIANVQANVASIPLSLEAIAELSVVSSTEKLLNEGAVGLAILLIVLVLLWPYLKLVSMLVTWFLPPSKLSPKRRSYVLDLLDVLGKWSFVEFFFVGFLLLSLGVEVENPDFGFNPPEAELLTVELELVIQRGLYLFVSAILLSMILSNISIFLDARTHPSSNRSGRNEKEGFSVAYTGFHNEHTTCPDDSFIQTTWLGRVVFSTTILASMILIISLVNIPLVETEFIGLIGILKGLESSPDTKQYFSISELLAFTLESDTGEFGYIFLGIVTVVIAILMPVIQQAHLLYIFFAKRTAEEAYHSIRVNKVLISWCCLEVFTLALVVSALEVRFVSKSFVDDECAALVEPLTILANAGFLDPEDADAVCFGVKGNTSPLVFLFIVAIILYKCTSFLVLSLLEISANQHKAGSVDTVEASHHHPMAYKTLRFLQLVHVSNDPEFTTAEALSFSNIVERINERNTTKEKRNDPFPLEQEQFSPPSRASNPIYSEASESVVV